MVSQLQPTHALNALHAFPASPQPERAMGVTERAAQLKARLIRDRARRAASMSAASLQLHPSSQPGNLSDSLSLQDTLRAAPDAKARPDVSDLIAQYSSGSSASETKVNPTELATHDGLPRSVRSLPAPPATTESDTDSEAKPPTTGNISSGPNSHIEEDRKIQKNETNIHNASGRVVPSASNQSLRRDPSAAIPQRPSIPTVPTSTRRVSCQRHAPRNLFSGPLAFRSLTPRPTLRPLSYVVPPTALRASIENISNSRTTRTPSSLPTSAPQPTTAMATEEPSPAATAPARNNEARQKESEILGGGQPPTLAQVLDHDKDLGEWLALTNYFNLEHRGKLLSQQRMLVQLEELKTKLVSEIQADHNPPVLLAPCKSPDLQFSIWLSTSETLTSATC